ncbi:hypothetical protein, variant [Magnaporthiopsis poae ATCC 64411]|uniref:Cyanovirin-N domain-containing protein n=1 Tax=Magnaporthiopsis poae (strain ATCC 64411 / 73-15) TaxID=644358 RepID=A0A0C4EGV2_MAGP6|nr:hypothetical protein, variant [Magnaporthiopsis poae ATCC 64411]
MIGRSMGLGPSGSSISKPMLEGAPSEEQEREEDYKETAEEDAERDDGVEGSDDGGDGIADDVEDSDDAGGGFVAHNDYGDDDDMGGILAYANFFANAAFTDETEIWRLAGGPANNILVAKWHRLGGDSQDVAGAAVDLNLCLGNFDGKLAWARGGMAMNTCSCSLTSRLWPGGDPKTVGFGSVDPLNDQLEISDYQRGEAGKDATKAILSCKCNASSGPVDSTINLDEGVEIKDGKLSCGSASGTSRHDASSHTGQPLRLREEAVTNTISTTGITIPTALTPPPAPATDLLYAGCKYIGVSASTPGKSILEAHCPVKTPAGSPVMYMRFMLDLDLCIVNNGGVAQFMHRGMGASSCKFSNTTNSVEWAYDCGGALGKLDITGRFTVVDNTLRCFSDGEKTEGLVPLPWACRDLRLSVDVPGTLIADCPTNLTQIEFTKVAVDMNKCIGVDENASPPKDDTAHFRRMLFSSTAFDNCRDCSLWNTTLSGSPANILNCNCRPNATAAWPDFVTSAMIGGEYVFPIRPP